MLVAADAFRFCASLVAHNDFLDSRCGENDGGGVHSRISGITGALDSRCGENDGGGIHSRISGIPGLEREWGFVQVQIQAIWFYFGGCTKAAAILTWVGSTLVLMA